MKKIFLILGSIVILVTFSCIRPEDRQNQVDPDVKETTDESSSGDNGKGGTVQLNNGEKWQANPETTQGIAAMQQLVSNFSTTPVNDDYKQLKENLESAFKIIFQKCTMTGEAHHQLHNYLLPLKELINDLDSDNPDESKKALNEIQLHLTKYSMYFV